MLAVIYAVIGFFGCLILRALGELILHRPSSGSLRLLHSANSTAKRPHSYPDGCTGWNWAMTAVADATAIAIYISWFGRYNQFFADIPSGSSAFIVVVITVALEPQSP